MLAVAGAAWGSPRHVIGSSRSSGDIATTIADGDAKNTKAVYVRGYGRGLSGLATVICSRGFSAGSKDTTLPRMVSGRLYRLRLPFAGDCTVAASLDGSGPIRLQILA